MFRKILIGIGLALVSYLFSAEIEFLTEPDEFLIFNRKNSKIYHYFKLDPEEKISFRTINVDTLEIFSRLILDNVPENTYTYRLQAENLDRIIKKETRKSGISRGVNGENISAFNKFKYTPENKRTDHFLTNTSQCSLIFKLDSSNLIKTDKSIEYIRFTPDFYDGEKVLSIHNKEYTYYTAKSGKIKFTLAGPIVLKIISRLVFDNNIVDSYNYRYRVFNDRELITEISEKAYRSQEALLKSETDKTPSTGDVNILKFGEGIHHLTIEDSDKNRDLIFRFYINKSSVEIKKQ